MLFNSFANTSSKKFKHKNFHIVDHNSGSSSTPARLINNKNSTNSFVKKNLSTSENNLQDNLKNLRIRPLEFGHWQVLGDGVFIKPLTLEQQKALFKKNNNFIKDLHEARVLGK